MGRGREASVASACKSIGPEESELCAPEAVGQAVGRGCQSGWGWLLSVTNAIEAGTWH